MPAPLNDLKAECDRVLIDNMSPGLKRALGDALARGVEPAVLLEGIRQRTGGPQSPRGGLTYLAAEAYIAAATGYDQENTRVPA